MCVVSMYCVGDSLVFLMKWCVNVCLFMCMWVVSVVMLRLLVGLLVMLVSSDCMCGVVLVWMLSLMLNCVCLLG